MSEKRRRNWGIRESTMLRMIRSQLAKGSPMTSDHSGINRRYHVTPKLHAIRNPDMKPLIHNGKAKR